MIKLATVFSGIGAIEYALKKNNIDYSIVFACDNGERMLPETAKEIQEDIINNGIQKDAIQDYIKSLYKKTKKENWVKKSYFANYTIKEKQWFDEIRFIDGNDYKGKIDLFVGGSPCQSFSNMGKRGGLEDTRGTLFYEFARLVKEIQPKIFIYENVPGMLNHDNGNTWSVIKNVFADLGYSFFFKTLNAKDYGIPQNRIRIYVIGFKNNDVSFSFPKEKELKTTMFDYLDEAVGTKYYLGEKGFKFVTSNTARAKVNEEVIRTQKANQQFNWNGNFVFKQLSEIKNIEKIKTRAYVGTYKGQKGVIRLLTPKECLRLMGFDDNFKIVVPDVQMYRQSGNSIVVNVLQEILKEIQKAGELLWKQ